MTESRAERNPVEVLADEFAERVRSGEHPLISEYTERFPEHSSEIDELFPSILMMERLKERDDMTRRREQRYRKLGKFQQVGDYQIVRQIGRGGMGVVFEAVQTSLGRRVALKVLSDSATASAKHLQRFEREARAAAALHHTNIVPVFGVGHEDDLHFYVMQYIDGTGLDEILAALRALAKEQAGQADEREAGRTGSAIELARSLQSNSFVGPPPTNSRSLDLRDRGDTRDDQYDAPTVEREPSGSGRRDFSPLTEELGSPSEFTAGREPPSPLFSPQYYRAVARVGLQVAKALRYAHGQGVLHRDIKPGNLLLDPQGTIWVTDFGLAKLTEHKDLTNSGDIVGTLRYMAPEQFDGKFDARCDVYSLGLTIYELLTLRPACDDTAIRQLLDHRSQDRVAKPRSLNPAVPRDLETIVLKTISADPKDRYQTSEALAEDLERFLEDLPIHARRFTPVERLVRWSRRNPALASSSAAVVLLLLLTAVTTTWGYFRSEADRLAISVANTRAEGNLKLALSAFERIIDNLGSRGVAQAFDLEFESEEIENPRYETVVTSADAELLTELLDFFDQFSRQNSAKLQAETAKAHQRMGNIQQRLGHIQAAKEHYRDALSLYEQLELVGVKAVPQLVARAETLNHLANLTKTDGERKRDSAEIREGMLLHVAARNLLASQPDEVAALPQTRFALAQTYLSMYPRSLSGNLHRPRRRGGGASQGKRSSRSRRLRGAGVDRSSAQSRGRPYSSLGVDWSDVLDDALSLLTQLKDEQPNNSAYRLALADALYRRVQTHWWDDAPIALKAHEESLAILERLVDDFPDQPKYRFELAGRLSISCQLVNCRYANKRLDRSVSMAEELAEQFPSVSEYQRLLRQCLERRGEQSTKLGEWETGAASYYAAIEIQEQLTQKEPSSGHQYGLNRIRRSLAATLREQGELEQSRELLERWINEQDAQVQGGRASSRGFVLRSLYEALALTQQKQRDWDGAVASYHTAIEIQAQFTQREPSWRYRPSTLTRVRLGLAATLCEQGDLEQARELLERWINELDVLSQELQVQNPRVTGRPFGDEQLSLYEALASTLEKQGDHSAADRWRTKHSELNELLETLRKQRERGAKPADRPLTPR